jgi:uncharacterized transporter YbjL
LKVTKELVFLVAVIVAGLTTMVLGLAVWANWSDGAIVGMASGFITLATGLIFAIRNQQKTSATLEQQDRKLDTVVAQTNGMSELERQEIADRAAVAVIDAWRKGKLNG